MSGRIHPMNFQFEQKIELPRSSVFAFHEDPEHLELLHRGWSTFRMLRHDGSVEIGSRTWVEITFAGILPVAMGFEHRVYEPPLRFGEHIVHGPFSKFSHIHEFEEIDGGTVVRDLLEVELPWHYGGEVAMRALVAPTLRRAFKFRRDALLKLAQAKALS